MDRVLIAGTNSGCGKTTVTTGLLCALKRRGLHPSAFKCGPDYIDPMFHREAIGVPSYTLDPFFSDAAALRQQICAHAGDISVIEGVMGYYDGIGPEGEAGSYAVARAADIPVILVLNARGMYTSAGAILQGFRDFREKSGIGGVIYNGISEGMYAPLARVAEKAGVVPLGFLPYAEDLGIGSRHLGLITAAELEGLEKKLERLGALTEAHIDVDGVLRLAASAPTLEDAPQRVSFVGHVRIAVASDKAFCFMYRENLELLEAMGAQIVPFSPMEDAALPEGLGGLYLCGGYPELYAAALSENRPMLYGIRAAIENGLPTIAECGGFLYLHDSLDGAPMAGLIHARAQRTEGLRRFGYATLRARRDNLLCAADACIRVHEFHYYESTDCGDGFCAKKAGSGREYPCVHATDTLYAGFPHLYFPANPQIAERFIRKAAAYASL